MVKFRIICGAMALFFWSLGANAQIAKPINIKDLPDPNLYKAIVKVKLFNIDDSGFLTNVGHGSGVIIDNDGTILTNFHVAAEENDFYTGQLNKIGYNICVVNDINKEPDCSYTADYIAGDKNLDLALLKLRSFPGGLELPYLPYLPIAQTDNTQTNDEVVAMGFPGIGGDTLSLTKGVVSGKIDKYGKKWIKTDALISYGNSGGAAVNTSGELIGVTSAGHSDMMGSMGYVINSVSIADWVKNNIDQELTTGNFKERIAAFAENYKNLITNTEFKSLRGGVSITRFDKWQFESYGEANLSISVPDDYDAGSVFLKIGTLSFAPKQAEQDRIIDLRTAVESQFGQILKKEKIKLAQGEATKIMLSSESGSMSNFLLAFNGRYIIKVSYDYGKNDKDKEAIDNIVKSIKLTLPKEKFESIYNYKNTDVFKYEFKNSKDWPIEVSNYRIPASVASLKRNGSNLIIVISTAKEDETKSFLTNEQTLQNNRKLMNSAKGMFESAGGSVTYKAEANCALTAKHKAIYEEVIMTMSDIKVGMLSYTFRKDAKTLTIGAVVIDPTASNIKQARSSFKEGLKGFSLEGTKFTGNCNAK